MTNIQRRGFSLALFAGAMLGGTQVAEAQEMKSPLDYARAEIHGHEVEIKYSRPSMRGRTIYGELVPWDKVWRTGANEATHLTIPVDMTIGGENVPAGVYTLWTVPAEDGWTLVINSETGQRGHAYNGDNDLLRVPMMTMSLDEPVETFTISIVEGEDSNGVIRLDWETTRAYVAFDLDG